MRILVGCLGSQNAINVVQSLRKYSDNYIVGMDAEDICAGIDLVDRFYTVPKTTEDEYFDTVVGIIDIEDIDVFLPIHSAEVEFFAKHNALFFKETNKTLCIPDYDVFLKLNDKHTFYVTVKHHFKNIAFIDAPDTHSIENDNYISVLVDVTDKQTMVMKKRVGSGTRDVFISNNIDDFLHYMQKIPNKDNYIIQKFIEGKEYTIDFVCDFSNICIGMVMRERMEIRDGKAVKGITVYNEQLLTELKKFLKKMKYVGAGNLQCIENNGIFYLTECNPRFSAGGLPLTIHAGLDIPYMVTQMAYDPYRTYKPFDTYKEGIIMCRYYTEGFIEDPVIIHVSKQ